MRYGEQECIQYENDSVNAHSILNCAHPFGLMLTITMKHSAVYAKKGTCRNNIQTARACLAVAASISNSSCRSSSNKAMAYIDKYTVTRTHTRI